MRLSGSLRSMGSGNRRWLFKQIWKRKGRDLDIPFKMSEEMKSRGIVPVDPNEHFRDPKPEWVSPFQHDPRWAPAPKAEDDPNWHEEPIRSFSGARPLKLGKTQVELLTKSQWVSADVIPRTVSAQVQFSKDTDHLIQRYIFLANMWHTDTDKLPVRQKPDDLAHSLWAYKSERGIQKEKSMNILLGNMIRQCFMLSTENMAQRRRCLESHFWNTTYLHEGHPVYIANTADQLILSDKPLLPVAGKARVAKTAAYTIPSMFPMSPRIDFQTTNMYNTATDAGLSPGFSHPHLHTLVLFQDNQWSSEERDCTAVLSAFGACVAQAKHRYGDEVGDLPEPLSVQAVQTDGVSFTFINFQLNTLDFESDAGVKNLVWVDSGNVLFEKRVPRRSMLRDTQYDKYNPMVFHKFLATFANE